MIDNKNNEIKWSFYTDLGTEKPVLLDPLTWKGGDQVSNLISILDFLKKVNISEKTKILIYKSGCGSGKCLSGDTLIATSRGIIKLYNIVKGIDQDQTISQTSIEESLDNNNVDNFNYIGDVVKSLNLNNMKMENDIISNVLDMGEKDIINISTRSGFNIKCTQDHKLVVIDDNGNIIYKEAKDITKEDVITIVKGTELYGEDVEISGFYQNNHYRKYKSQSRIMILPHTMNIELAEFLGYIFSEGRREERKSEISNDDESIRNRIIEIINKLGFNAYDVYDSRRKKFDGVSISSVMFKDFLSYIGYKAENKEVPWSILQSSKNVQIAFLKALFSGDGYIGNENTNYIEYYTTSKILAEQLHIMLLNMGIFSSLKSKESVCCSTRGYEKDCGTCYRLSIYGRDDIIKYIKTIGFVQEYKKSRCKELLNVLESREKVYQSRTVKGSNVRLKNIHEEFKKLGKEGKIIKIWKEDIIIGNTTYKVTRKKKLSSHLALKERGFINGISKYTADDCSSGKQFLLKLLKSMKECHYLEDFKYLYNIATSNLEFDPVDDIKNGKEHVYDLTIEENHSYVGNGFINHNSATLLHVVENLGKGIIVTPFKNLQRQYFDDYFKGKKFVLKNDGTRLKVSVMLGRSNFKCPWLEEQYDLQQRLIKECENPDNFGRYIPVDDNILRMYRTDNTCANRNLPCIKSLQFIGGKRKESRWESASICPYWIPTPISKNTIDKWRDKIVSEGNENDREGEGIGGEEIEGENIPDIKKTSIDKNSVYQLDIIMDKINCHDIRYYESTGWGTTGVFIRDDIDKNGKKCAPVCDYYKQFYNYVDADCIIMNDAKWHLETHIGRKPKISIEIFDEGDYWLDSRSVTLEFPKSIIEKMMPISNKMERMKKDTIEQFEMAFQDIKNRIIEQLKKDEDKYTIIDLKNYKDLFLSMTNLLLENKKSSEEDDSILQRIFDIATVLRYLDRASISYKEQKDGKDGNKIIQVFIPYPDSLLRELFKRSSKNIIITSGTIHSDSVLENLFGINNNNYVVDFVQGRRESPGKLRCAKPEGIVRLTHTTWQSPQFQEYYYGKLNYILDNLKIMIDKITGRPGEGKILVLTPAKKYVDGILRRDDIFVDFAKSREEDDDIKVGINTTLSDYLEKNLEDVRKIKNTDLEIDGNVLRTEKQIIISTRMTRGADLSDDKCRGVVMTKWPTADVSAGYYQALKKRFGDNIFWAIVKDRAEREGVQYVCRGLRHDRDWCIFSTPDDYAFNNIFRLFSYD